MQQAAVANVFANRCAMCAVRSRAVCGALSDREIETLSAVARQRHFKAGETILNAEEDAVSFGNIISGVVKLSKIMADGRQQIVGLQFASDFLGRPYRDRHPYFAEAATDVELCVFPRKGFQDLLAAEPQLEKRLFRDTLDELDAARDWMLLLGRKTAREKVATFLALIARRTTPQACESANDDVLEIALPLTRAEIADYLGLTIETVSRQIGKLKSEGLIAVGGAREITVLDPAGLVAESHD